MIDVIYICFIIIESHNY